MEALKALDPVQGTFLDVSKVKPLLDLTKTPALDSEFEVACNFLRAQMEESSPPDGEKWTMKQVIKTSSSLFLLYFKKLQGSF